VNYKTIYFNEIALELVTGEFYDYSSWQGYCDLMTNEDMRKYKGFYSERTNKIILGNFLEYRKHWVLAESKSIGNFSRLGDGWYGFDIDAYVEIMEISLVSFHYNTRMEQPVLADFTQLIQNLFGKRFDQIRFRDN